MPSFSFRGARKEEDEGEEGAATSGEWDFNLLLQGPNCQRVADRGTVRPMNPPALFDAALVALLRCPETGQMLAPAPAGVLSKLDAARVAGRLANRAGRALKEPVTEGLLRADGAVIYPIAQGIPLLTTDDAVIVPQS